MTFSSDEARKLIEAALTNPTSHTVRLAIHAVRGADLSLSQVVLSSLKESGFSASNMAQVLRSFAEYEGLVFVLAALDDDYLMIRAAAVDALLALNDKAALKPLEHMLDDPKHKDLNNRISQTVMVIRSSKRPQPKYKQLESLSDEDYAFAEAVLGRKFVSEDISSLVRKLGHHDSLVRKHAVKTLMASGDVIADDFYSALRKQRIGVSRELIDFIGHWKHPGGSGYVISVLETLHHGDYESLRRNSEIRKAGITALTNIADSQAITYLVQQLTIEGYDEGIALERIGAPAAPYLLRAYREHEGFRRSGGAALVRILSGKALPVLLEGLEDRFREVREDAQSALEQLGNIAVKPLITLLDHQDGIVRRHACRVLSAIGDGRAKDALLRLSHSSNLNDHWEAVEALGSIRDSRTVDELSRWLDSPNCETRRRVAKALRKQVNEKAALLLIKASTDEDRGVRIRAIDSIAEHLYRVTSEQAKLFPVLVLAVDDADPEIATLAKEELVWLGDNYPEIRQRLNTLLTNLEVDKSTTIADIVRQINLRVGQRRIALSAEPPPPPPLISKIPRPITDAIHFSVTAPRVIGIEDSFVLDVWAHFGYLKTDVLLEAKQALAGRDVHMRSRGPIQIERNTTLRVLLSIPTFDTYDMEETIYWAGETGNCTFSLTVSPNAAKGFHLGVAKFFVAELQVCKLSFEIEVGLKTVAPADLTTRADRIKTAFASYASEERNKVTARIQGMLKIMPELDIFLDVMSLHSGDNWARKLEDEIIERDVFYLFWSRAASKSQWVDIEWRTALTKKGLEYIDPVPLEPPNEVPPPPELSSLHFNEWTLAFEKKSTDSSGIDCHSI